ncbi:MAG TPA: universal stress protein [Anaeromyxobacteraceae bacterium]|nr:universal stress protein [Anaeromyxobacteraceae bacterium]
MPAWKKILCATDFSPPSRIALLQAAELAAANDAQLWLLHVREAASARPQLGMMPSPPEAYEVERGEAWRQLERAGAEATVLAKSHVGVEMIEGSPIEEILRAAREREVDVIVLGTHGRTGVRRAVLGSVAELVVRRAPCSVLVVRPEELLAVGRD